tara:strand:- start:23623 stop:24552 length:930 start_codon:yes stop_codon:yes gene_type:complete
MELRLSHSQVNVARKCLYEYKLHYVKGVRRATRPTYFAFGIAVHEGIRSWYQGLPLVVDGKHLVDRIYEQEIDHSRVDAMTLQKLNVEKAKVRGIVEGYIGHYSDDLTKYDRILTERDAKIPLDVDQSLFKNTKFTYATFFGYLDCLIQDKSGDWWIKETKTTGDNIDDFIAAAAWSDQLCGYMVLAKSILGVWPRGVLFDVIVKSSIQQRTSRKPESLSQFQRRCYNLYKKEGAEKNLFVRREILFNPRHIKVWKREILLAAEDILDSLARKRFPMNTASCKGKFGMCDKFSICSTGKIRSAWFDIKK